MIKWLEYIYIYIYHFNKWRGGSYVLEPLLRGSGVEDI